MTSKKSPKQREVKTVELTKKSQKQPEKQPEKQSAKRKVGRPPGKKEATPVKKAIGVGKAPSKRIRVKKVRTVNNKKEDCLKSVSEGIITPVALVEASFTVAPFFYNQYSKGRFNITLAFDRKDQGDNSFIEWVDKLSTDAGVPAKLWVGRKKRLLLKFQTAEKIPTYRYVSQKKKPELVTLTEELVRESYAQVTFSILKYHDRKRETWAFSFQPTKICVYPDKKKDFYNVDYTSGRD